MLLILSFTILQLVFVKNTQAQVLLSSCPNVEVVNDFDASKYVGFWYEFERYPAFFEVNAICVTATYTANPDGSIGVLNENINSMSRAYKFINGTATFDGPSNIAKLGVVFPSVPGPKGKYWVVGTDYKNYSIVWACSQFAGSNYAFAWVLTREKSPSEEILKKVYNIIDKFKIPKQHFTKTEQQKCDRSK